ncbi:MAG: hypothetical protein OXS29_19390 [bacterium]|nr:hypothetical protein [bacterium]MDE0437325.1 hypothetical protein [bacterium]
MLRLLQERAGTSNAFSADVEGRETGVGVLGRWVCLSVVVAVLLVLACGGDGQVVYFDSQSELVPDRDSTRSAGTVSASPLGDEPVAQLDVVPSVEVASLRAIAVDRVNRRRAELGYSPLEIGDSVAAQYVAEQALTGLRLTDYTRDGLPIDAVYTATGGRGSVLSSSHIRGYFDAAEIIQCRSALVICTRTDAAGYLSDYVDSQLADALPQDPGSLLFADWEKLHVGVAYTDFTFVVVLQLEHQQVTHLKETSVSGGFLSLELAPYDGISIASIDIYYYPPPASPTASLFRNKVLSVHRPPDSGHILNLPDSAIVADYWSSNGQTTSIVASLDGHLPGPGIYEVIVWAGSELPASSYFINIETADLQPDPNLRPFEEPEVPTLHDLRLFALELINLDRQTHGVAPVRLGSNQAAQAHAEDAARNGYGGHWTSDGLKPYMLYTQAGGVGVIAENAAWQARGSENCDDPTIVCGDIDVAGAIESLQWSMVYDDAHANWGHRDTILDPIYDTVNIGIAFTDSHVAYYQHFEYTRLTHETVPKLTDGTLRLRLRPRTGFEIGHIEIYYDPPPTPKRPEEISGLRAYCVGGGFTDDCENVEPITRVLAPPPPGSHYVGLGPDDVVAGTWNLQTDGSVTIEADLRQFITTSGVYTILIVSQSEDPELLAMYSLNQ